jgi:sphingomyelin phosphodiesterase
LIYHTGDIVDHGVWETTESGNIQIMERVFNLFKEVFGSTPVFHVLGNHEGNTTNVRTNPLENI